MRDLTGRFRSDQKNTCLYIHIAVFFFIDTKPFQSGSQTGEAPMITRSSIRRRVMKIAHGRLSGHSIATDILALTMIHNLLTGPVLRRSVSHPVLIISCTWGGAHRPGRQILDFSEIRFALATRKPIRNGGTQLSMPFSSFSARASHPRYREHWKRSSSRKVRAVSSWTDFEKTCASPV